MQLKRDSPTDVVAALGGLEGRADVCFHNLELNSFPKGMASWAILVSLVATSERVREEHGYKNYDVNLINLSNQGALAIQWVQEKGLEAKSDPHTYRWTRSLARAVAQALSIAASYQVFLGCFPMWHQNREFAELRSGSGVRFTVPGGPPARRVSAFQKGFRPASNPVQDEGLVLTAEQTRQRDIAFSRCFYSGELAIAYPEPMELYRSLLPSYVDRYNAMFRRADLVDLGPYNLGELKRAYAALATIFSAHEDFCFRFGRKHEYPVNSCVMMRTRDEWASLIARIADLGDPKCFAILDDLTVSDRFWDLHVQPFILVGEKVLAVAPQFPLSSRADENILRVCNHRRKSRFHEAARMKEEEMIDDLLQACPKPFSASVKISLGDSLPDIDFLLVDENHRAVIVAELKWLRKPSSQWKERIHREEDFRKGLQQLSDIRTFLKKNPGFLSGRGKLMGPLNEYEHVAFVFVVRDFFLWPESEDLILADHEAFKDSVGQAADLAELIDRLRTYDWLPVEGKHFRVAFEPVGLNGVTLESETFYRI